jgi:two-component sensor histidine kinase
MISTGGGLQSNARAPRIPFYSRCATMGQACPQFDLTKSKGLGMRVVTALAKQLNGNITLRAVPDGTEFALLVPL